MEVREANPVEESVEEGEVMQGRAAAAPGMAGSGRSRRSGGGEPHGREHGEERRSCVRACLCVRDQLGMGPMHM